ncbi:MAG: ABC transporter ATP-binding protein [Spirochaetaceae bacterium]|jgi:lipoprotein-releasing system ATP-binding protein|nr:ABC transporter ATP-binding protein [Spirochaetaceae bacterium]
MSDIIIDVKDLVKNYKSGTETLRILRSLNFQIERGRSLSIMGSSGSGKSTLLNILGGLDRFDGGSCMVGGKDIGRLSEKNLSLYRRNNVGFIFQFHYLLKDFTALENVMLPAYIAGENKKTALEKARILLEEVRLSDRSSHYPAKLSGGERQRVAVARSMINDPDIILADEPTGNLDSEHGEMVADLLFSGAEKHNKTLIVVSHDEKIASRARIQYSLINGCLERRDGQ